MTATAQPKMALFYLNGLNGATGEYLSPPLAYSSMRMPEADCSAAGDHLQDLAARAAGPKDSFGFDPDLDPGDLAQSGWGAVFAVDANPEIREALMPLLQMRHSQAGDLYREYGPSNGHGYRPGQTARQFLAEQGMGPGSPDPAKVPYHLLLVGDPEAIPFSFQYELDVQYCVGRLSLDAIDDYAAYARSVVKAESEPGLARRTMTMFAPCNQDDRATELSSRQLVEPLAKALAAKRPDWRVKAIVGDGATRQAMLAEFKDAPSLLFSASHGLFLPSSDPAKFDFGRQGALVCQDWLGPQEHQGPLNGDCYLSAADIPDGTRLDGTVAFLFACFGGGMPRSDYFPEQRRMKLRDIAPRAFVAALPQRMLAAGALAVVAHVERAWSYSIAWPGAGAQTTTFEYSLRSIMKGGRVGLAMDQFGQRYAELAVSVAQLLDRRRFGALVDEAALACEWTACNDARSYVILGDPAVKVC